MNFKSILFLLLIITYSWSNAQTVNIDGDPYGGNPYSTINAAITAANDGDVILISGIHTETLSFNKSITLRGADPSTDIIQAAASPASDGSGSQVISIFADPATPANITIENLGIRHGNQGGINGGGFNVDKVTGLITLRNLIIEDNYTNELGGGLAIAGSNVDIINCTIKNNLANKAGGGIILAPNNASGLNNIINIQGSLINNNEGLNGGGIYINGNPGFGNDYLIDVNIENSTLSNNTANSGGGAAGGGAIWSKSLVWTTNDGGDGSSANVRLELVHTTLYKNFHVANIKSGIQGTGTVDTEFSAYNSIIVYDGLAKKSINFQKLNHIEVKNCILGGLNAPPGSFLDDAARNNVRGKTASFAGLTGTLSNSGGNTQVIEITSGSNADDYCTASVTAVTLPLVDQRGYDREGTSDAGAFEFGGTLPQPCEPPLGVTNTNVASTGASFSWNPEPAANTGFEWIVVNDNGDPDLPADVVTQGTTASGVNRASALSLTEQTTYDFYVRSDCGTEFSDWSSAVSFTTSFEENLIQNSRFTDATGLPSIVGWEGYGTGSRVDDLTGKIVGFINLSDGAFRQDFSVVPGVIYSISFNYRWVTTTGSTNPNDLTPVIRDPNINGGAGVIESLPSLQTNSDVWYTGNYIYTHPINSDLDVIRLQFFKADQVNEISFRNISVLEDLDLSTDYDYVYQNETWSPSIPTGVSTTSDDVLIFNGNAEITSDLDANTITVEPWADLDVFANLNLNSSLTVNGEAEVTFKNDDNNLGQLESGSITGDVTVERFIPVETNNSRAFRFLTSPVDSNEPIYDNWQESGNSPIGYGTHISGSDTGANGFDETISGNPSMYLFDNAYTGSNQDDAWNPISNTDTNMLNTGEAYLVFIRGDRNYDLDSNPADNPNRDITLRAKGALLSGNQTFSLSGISDYYSLVGNPYQAIVNVDNLNTTNVNTNFYWAWDPNMATRGAYVAIDLATFDSQTPSGGSSNSDANQFVMPGQSFFVQTINNDDADITFTESSKDVNATPTAVFSDDPISKLNFKLYISSDFNNQNYESDAIDIVFGSQYNNSKDIQDASKFTNPDENLASLVNNQLLSINKRNLPSDNESLPLYLTGYTVNDYTFVISKENLPDDIDVYLVDSYVDSETLLIEGENTISFSIDQNIPASIDSARFEVKFEVSTFGVNDQEFANQVKVYPNPVIEGNVTIKSNAIIGEAKISLHNLLGQKITEDKFEFDQNGEVNIHLDNYQSGVYYIQLNQGELSFNQKLIIK